MVDKQDSLATLLEQMDYPAWLEDTSQSPTAAARRLANVTELLAWIGRIKGDDDSIDLAAIVQKLTLSDLLDRNQEEAETKDEKGWWYLPKYTK